MDLQLKGLKALVTGSSSGIGAGIAAVLAREGCRVVVHGRDAARTRAVAERITGSGAEAWFVVGDLATPEGSAAVADEVQRLTGGVDILVNNAGGKTAAGNPAWFDVPWSDWLGTYEQNVGAAVRLAHAFAPACRRAASGASSTSPARRRLSPKPRSASIRRRRRPW